MKKIKIHIWFTALFFIMIAVSTSCNKSKLAALNTPWNGSPTASVAQLSGGFMANLFLSYGDQATANGWIYAINQQGAEYTRSDYTLAYGAGDDWTNYYHNLSNYNALMNTIAKSPDTAIYKNVKAIMTVLKAYQTIKVSNEFGDMPYSKAGQIINNPQATTPAYDKQQAIYVSVLKDLKTAVANLDATDTKQYSLGGNDFILQNNIPNWIKFANSLRLRIAVTMYDKDPADATPVITDALTKPLLDDNLNVGVYPANVANMDLGGRAFSFGQECRMRMGSEMWNMMSSNNNLDGSGIFDPRCTVFFEPNNAGQWNPFPQNPTASTPAEGGDPYNKTRGDGTGDFNDKNGAAALPNSYADFNFYWGQDLTMPELFMTAAQVHFLKAEIYARGLGTTVNMGTAQTEYNAGVALSVNFWIGTAINATGSGLNASISSLASHPWATALPTQAAMNTFMANPVVAFSNDPATALKQIYAQQWIDMIRQPWEAWTLLRRTGGLTPMDPNNSAYYATTYGGYNRFVYPDSELQYNSVNFLAETNGVNITNTKIWIAK